MKYRIPLLACSLLCLSPGVALAGKKPTPSPQVSPTAITKDAAAFLDDAIDIMRQHALHGESIDWVSLRTEAFKRAGGAFNPIDTYPAIYWALVQLNDPGSHLRLPAGLYPDQIALMQQAEREAANSAPAGTRTSTTVPTPFTARRLPEGHIVTAQGRNFGYVVLPRCSAKDNDGLLLYAADVRRILTDLSGQDPKGWIVDLRGNTGGNMWPMLTGIGPILGDGAVGSFVAADGNVTWFYKDGATGTRNPAGLETVSLTLQDSPVLMTPSAPVAILVDSSTASSAEAITIAFHGRPSTRFFGTHTAGKSTAVQPYKLDDGAEIYLTTAIDADRSGKSFPDGFTPDEIVSSTGASIPQQNSDPVMLAAQKWLVADTPSVPVPPTAPKTRRGKAAVVHQEIASATIPTAQPSVAPTAPAQTQAASSTPAVAPAKTETVASSTPAVAPAKTETVASSTPAVAPAKTRTVATAPAVAPAKTETVAISAPAVAPAKTETVASSAPAVVPTKTQTVASTPAAATDDTQTVASSTPAAPKPKAQHKKVVVHQGS